MSETAEQREFVKYFLATWPEHANSLRVSMTAVSKRGRAGAILWGVMKSLGVQKGEADIAILIPKGGFGSLIIEHKGEGQAHKLSEHQQNYLDYHQSIGNQAVSTRGLEALKAAVLAYMGE
jgi:hypothetical protein